MDIPEVPPNVPPEPEPEPEPEPSDEEFDEEIIELFKEQSARLNGIESGLAAISERLAKLESTRPISDNTQPRTEPVPRARNFWFREIKR